MPFMDLLIRVSLFLWIAVGHVTVARGLKCKEDEDETYNVAAFKHVFRDACYEFSQEPKTWNQARESCEKRGGMLLNVIDCKVEKFLRNFTLERNFTGDRNFTEFSWWVGEGVLGEYQGPPVVLNSSASEGNGMTPLFCTYIMLHPFHLVTTSNCSEGRGYLCTLALNGIVNSHSIVNSESIESSELDETNGRGSTNPSFNGTEHQLDKRSTRSQSLHDMQANVNNTDLFLQATNLELLRMEQTAGEPTYENTIEYMTLLLAATKRLTPEYVLSLGTAVGQFISSTGAILLLDVKKCGPSWDRTQQEELFNKMFEVYTTISLLLGTATKQHVVITHPTGKIYHSSYNLEALSRLFLETKEGVTIILPSLSALQPKLGNLTEIGTQLATFSESPYLTNESITGMLCSFSLLDDQTELHLSNLTEMIEINLPRSNTSVSNTTVSLEDNSTVLTSFNMSDPNQTVVFNVEPNKNISLLLLLAPDSPPNHTHYNHRTILQHTGGYRWLVTPEMMEGRTGLWYISSTLYNATWWPGLELQVTIFTSKCMYWDPGLNSWSTAGCRVGEKSRPEVTQCLCNHLTFFGSSFFVMPNYIDLTRTAEYFSTASDNYVVLTLLSAFFGLYLLTLLWACYTDRKAQSRRKMTLLEDSHPCSRYNYLLRVQTGKRKGAGTSAKVLVKLRGSEGESETHQLTDPDKPAVLEQGAVDVFLLATPFPLGELQSLHLGNDSGGERPSWGEPVDFITATPPNVNPVSLLFDARWLILFFKYHPGTYQGCGVVWMYCGYVDKVTVQDLQTRQVCHFLCSSWLSADKGEGLTKKTFTPAKKNEIASFRNIFQSRTSTGFRDEHIWVSVVDPPWRSPFTRAQRVSCCMCLLLCTMAINIAFWNLPQDQNFPVIVQIGPLEITWQQIMVGVESGLLMFPINILIITIFRSIRPRLANAARKETGTLKPRAVTMPTVLKDTEELVSLLSRSQRNKTSELKERLQSGSDLCLALESIHSIIQLMQGESDSNPHWVFCSQFVRSCLHHLSWSLERLDPKAFSSPEEHQQVLSTSNLLLKTADMVYTSHMAYCPPPVCKRPRGSGCWLPWWFVFLGWFLLLSISGISAFFTLLYGFDYGRERSIQWVISLGLSLFQSIFILQPLKVIVLAVIFALLLRPVAVEENEEIELLLAEQQERHERYSGTQMY